MDCAEIVNDYSSDEKQLVVQEDTKEINNFRNMFYYLNAIPDSLTRVYSKRFVIDCEEIIDLNNRILEKIRMLYKDDGF